MLLKKYITRLHSTRRALCLFLLFSGIAVAKANSLADSSIIVPLGGNGWVGKTASAKIGNRGLSNWTDGKDIISVYVRVENAESLNVALKLIVPDGKSTISIASGKSTLVKTVSNTDTAVVDFGKIAISAPGYIELTLQGTGKTGKEYARVSDMLLSGPALNNGAAYVKNNKGNYFYWGHRGPSVHLKYQLPQEIAANTEWFYNEVTVPVGQDVLGSYFMADGFTGGYFGMQVNSPTERHVLFSIWSPFNTDDPKKIPDSLKIKLLKKGSTVHAGEFGSEGSGGQSYLNYPWVAGKTYAFLIHAQADAAAKTTTFTAYFKEAGAAEWQLIASFKRPVSGFYLKGLYSFLENFNPEMGTLTRKVNFGNQWAIDTNGKWYAVNDAQFTADATANINYRKDYSGGVNGNQFYLRNCGFFNDFTPIKTQLKREPTGKSHPDIDFNKLP